MTQNCKDTCEVMGLLESLAGHNNVSGILPPYHIVFFFFRERNMFCYHPQVNARTELAIRYNDISPLENHHCAVAFDTIQRVTYGNVFIMRGLMRVPDFVSVDPGSIPSRTNTWS